MGYRKVKMEKPRKTRRPSSLFRESGLDRAFKKTVDLCGEKVWAKFAKKSKVGFSASSKELGTAALQIKKQHF